MALPVTLTGREDGGTGILEHRDEVRHDDGLREQILRGTEEEGTLPLPPAFLHIIITAMALPYADMPVEESACDEVGP